MDLAEAWRTLPLGAAESHAEALTLAATRALRAGRPADAFEFADRRCRISARPRAVDLAIRALAAHLCGRPEEAERDLSRAEAADPLDPMVAITRLRLATAPDDVRRLADVVAGGGHAAPNLLGAVLTRLHEPGAAPCLVGLDILDGLLSGLAAWPAGRTVELELSGPDAATVLPLVQDPSLSWAVAGVDACLVDTRPPFAAERYRLCAADGTILAEGRIWPRRSRLPLPPVRSRAPEDVPSRAPLTIVVPVYLGLEETRDCLEALAADATLHEDVRIVAVDDASPDPEIADLLDDLAAKGVVEVRRNAANLGFAGAVMLGLKGEDGRDILFLNADAVLPPGALDRLAAAVYSAPDIGTATPFSNNGEYTSLPRHAEADAAPSPEDARRIDAAAARVDGGVIDLPTGTGFCLFVRHDCMAAVGGMPAVYGRGYFEDLEFCLRARRAGFRNVCATSLYVVHRGSVSFGTEKRALAVRNLALVRRRFPSIEAECAAYAEADPLRGARRAIAAEAGIPFSTEREIPAGTLVAVEGAGAGRPPSLGVLSPFPSPEGDAFVRRLSAALRARLPEARIVVLGASCDDLALMGRGNVFVTGPLGPGEERGSAGRYGVVALVPPAAGPAAAFLRAAIDIDLPVLHPADPGSEEPGTLVSDIRDHANDAAHAIVAQFARRIAA